MLAARPLAPLDRVRISERSGDETMTIGIVATLKVQDGKGAEFEAVFKELSEQVRASEPGCLMYQLTKSRADPNTYKVLELYKDQESLTHHGGTDYFRA